LLSKNLLTKNAKVLLHLASLVIETARVPSDFLTKRHLLMDVKPPGAWTDISQPSSTGVKNAVYQTPPLQSFFGTNARLSSTLYSCGIADGSETSFISMQSGFKCRMTSTSCISWSAVLSVAALERGCSEECEKEESNMLSSCKWCILVIDLSGKWWKWAEFGEMKMELIITQGQMDSR
jgi:hypothetical protein